MIIKVMSRKAEQDVSDATALLMYIRAQRPRDLATGGDKLAAGYGGALGFGLAGDTDAGLQDMLLERLIRENRACRKPLMHTLISWNSGIRPTKAEVREAVEVWLQEVGADGLPAIWEAHDNTANFHAHILLCRLDPEQGGRARELGLFKRKSQKAKTKLEALQGLQACAGDLYVPVSEDGTGVTENKDARYWKAGENALDALPALSNRAQDMEHRTGMASAETVAREVAWPRIEAAASWTAVHEALAEVDCRLMPRKGGLVLMVGDEPVKASKVHRKCARKALEKRLGAFEPASSVAAEEPDPSLDSRRPQPQGARKPSPCTPKPAEQADDLEETQTPVQEQPVSVAGRLLRPVPGMDEEIEEAWLKFQAATEEASQAAKARAAFWKEESRKLKAHILQGRRRTATLMQEARAHGLRYQRVFRGALLRGIERHGRVLRTELDVARRADRAGRPRFFCPSFADWLASTGRAELAERWRRRLSVALDGPRRREMLEQSDVPPVRAEVQDAMPMARDKSFFAGWLASPPAPAEPEPSEPEPEEDGDGPRPC